MRNTIICDAGWSSLVARRAHNPEVVGSNPTPAPNFKSTFPSGKRCFFVLLLRQVPIFA